MSGHDAHSVPRLPLIAAGVLVLASLAGVGAVRAGLIGGPVEAAPVVAATVVATRDVRFLDQDDGSILVQAAGSGQDMVIGVGEGSFVRGLVRSLTYDRRSRGIGREPAFRMAETSDGRLTLTDTATGRVLVVNAFGPDNRQAFRDLLHQVPGKKVAA